MGCLHLRPSDRGRGRAARTVRVGRVHRRAGPGEGRLHGHGGLRPLPPLPRGRGPARGSRCERLPFLGLLAPGRLPGRPGLLRPAGGRAVRGGRPPGADPLPLGPARRPGLAGAGHGGPLRRPCDGGRRPAGRPGHQVDHAQRARRTHPAGPRPGRARPRQAAAVRRPPGRPPPAPRPWSRGAGAARGGRARHRHRQLPRAHLAGLRRPGRRGGGGLLRHAAQPPLRGAGAAGRVPGRARRADARGRRRRPAGDRGAARLVRRQLLRADPGGRPAGHAVGVRRTDDPGRTSFLGTGDRGPCAHRLRLAGGPGGADRAAVRLPRPLRRPVAADRHHRERLLLRGPGRPGAHRLPGRPSACPARRVGGGRGRARLLRLVPAGQLRVGRGVRAPLRAGARGPRHAGAHPEGVVPVVPGRPAGAGMTWRAGARPDGGAGQAPGVHDAADALLRAAAPVSDSPPGAPASRR
ncbi:GH1 / GH5_19 [Streptomyces misionensis JCM 4497]